MGTAGLLAGTIVSGVQVAISASNTGGAWDNAKKEVEAEKARFRRSADAADVNVKEYETKYLELAELKENQEDDTQTAEYKKYEKWGARSVELKEMHVAAVVGDTFGDPLKDTSGPAINILVKLSAITSLVFGNYLAHYHFFGNAAPPIRYATELLAYCNSAGENPNTVDMVLKNCNTWLESGYFTYRKALPAAPAHADADQKGISYDVWYKEDQIAKNKA